MMDSEPNSELVPRILALDVGQKRVGVAVSDPMGMFAVGLETIEVQSKQQLLNEIQKFCETYQPVKIVLGLPRHMKGHEGPESERVRKLAERIQEVLPDIAIDFIDERLTSVLAHQTLREQGIKASRNKGLVDQAAAKRILQDYMERNANRLL